MLKWDNRALKGFVMRKAKVCGPMFFVLSLLFPCIVFPSLSIAGPSLEFSVHDLASGKPGATALIVGGIQGDEPGGFNAAALITTHYDIRSGRVIVVPNLNFPSIVRRSRGVHGDMNRKFDRLTPDDPEWKTVGRIKSLITSPDVDFILNLHDGSGFYTRTWESARRNPNRWGQSIIIDQARMPESSAKSSPGTSGKFDHLEEIALGCARDMNTRLLSSDHRIHVKNTRTAEGNREMEKTLTYFALKHGKPAFGIEASKSFVTSGRVYYHLLAIEAFLTRAGILFERRFTLTDAGIRIAMDEDITVHLGNRRVLVMAENVRNHLRFIPMEKGWDMDFHVNHPLLTLVPKGNGYQLYHGNRRLTRLDPQYFEYDLKLAKIDMVVDGRDITVPLGSRVAVRERFLVQHIPEHRVNIIGFSKQSAENESGFVVRETDILNRYSIDRAGRIYRVEVYGGGRFNGMVLVDFRAGQPRMKLARADAPDKDRQALLP